jgi:hypothetical protein
MDAPSWGNLLELGERRAGEFLEIEYPLPLLTEQVVVGNPGFRQYSYEVTWKGDTVVKIEPVGNDQPSGYSDFDKRQVAVFYGKDGPAPLYERQDFLRERPIQHSSLHCDQVQHNFWKLS